MSKPFGAQIDALYAVPLSQFVAARTALAKTATGDDAERIRTLPKPATLPWVVNQLRWHERTLYERVIKAGAALRTAQIAALEGRGTPVVDAAAAHRKALGEAVIAAGRLAREGGVTVDSDALQRMLATVSLAETLTEPHGRFTRIVQPAGFEALRGIAVRAPVTPPRAETPESSAPSRHARGVGTTAGASATATKEAERRERVQAEVAAHAAALRKAERALAKAREQETAAREAWHAARDRADAADEALQQLRAQRR